MSFYEEISKYYDYIFPVSRETVEFIKERVGRPSKAIIDIACGTGGYAIELNKEGYALTAIDIDSEMIQKLSQKTMDAVNKIEFLISNMKEINSRFNEMRFDAAYCIGNSLVHLDDITEIEKFFIDVRELLKRDGKFIFQIINFDRIINKNIKSLPTITNESIPLKFERFYRYKSETNKVMFKTILSLEDKAFENEIPLMPLKSDEAIEFLKKAGFSQIKAYGDFKGNMFDKDNSYMLVIEAKV